MKEFAMVHPWMTFFLGLAALRTFVYTIAVLKGYTIKND